MPKLHKCPEANFQHMLYCCKMRWLIGRAPARLTLISPTMILMHCRIMQKISGQRGKPIHEAKKKKRKKRIRRIALSQPILAGDHSSALHKIHQCPPSTSVSLSSLLLLLEVSLVSSQFLFGICMNVYVMLRQRSLPFPVYDQPTNPVVEIRVSMCVMILPFAKTNFSGIL